MKKFKKISYLLIIAIFIITAIRYVLGIVYILGNYFLSIKLLPEPVWDGLELFFYKEAGPMRVAMSVATFVVLSILLAIFYRKDVSKATIILPATNLIISVLWWTCALTDNANTEIGYIIMSVFCVIHTVITGFFLIKDREGISDQ